MTTALVNCAALLFESAPFVLAGALALRLPVPWRERLVPYLGCGCSDGPSARSLPAAAAAWFAFGPAVALLRFAGAVAIERLILRGACASQHVHETSLLDQLRSLMLPALGAAVIVPLLPAIAGSKMPPAPIFILMAAAAFASAPCGLGAIAASSVLRTISPAAAAGFLSVAGLFDVRTWSRARCASITHDAPAYALAAIACALVASRHGAGLVNPKIAFALAPCAFTFAWLAIKHRFSTHAGLRIAPAIMLAGCVLSSAPPAYQATETTLADAFAGERIDFTGKLVRQGSNFALVRYAITCCRADAAPVIIRLDRAPGLRAQWIRARGALVHCGIELCLHWETIEQIASPADPFIYR